MHLSDGAPPGVRPARAADVTQVAALQAATWQGTYARTLPDDVLEGLRAAAFEPAWRRAVERPPSRLHRVLAAAEGATVVGFAALSPAEDPDCDPQSCAELLALAVDPLRRGEGHGSRLLQAVADLLAEDAVASAVCWVGDVETGLADFLRGAGWAADGAVRELDVRGDASLVLRQARYATALPTR